MEATSQKKVTPKIYTNGNWIELTTPDIENLKNRLGTSLSNGVSAFEEIQDLKDEIGLPTATEGTILKRVADLETELEDFLIGEGVEDVIDTLIDIQNYINTDVATATDLTTRIGALERDTIKTKTSSNEIQKIETGLRVGETPEKPLCVEYICDLTQTGTNPELHRQIFKYDRDNGRYNFGNEAIGLTFLGKDRPKFSTTEDGLSKNYELAYFSEITNLDNKKVDKTTFNEFVNNVNSRITSLDGRVTGIDTRVTNIENLIGEKEVQNDLTIFKRLENIESDLDDLTSRVETLEQDDDLNITNGEGDYSIAQESTEAFGDYAFSEGYRTTATHDHSHAGGEQTKTSRVNQTVIGEYNADNTSALFIVGNGSAADDTSRSNAFVVEQDGSCTAVTFEATTFVATSDKRLKENIEPYSCEKSILDLPVYEYNFIKDNGKKKHIGCLAQDLQKICPELVEENSDGYLSIQESKLVYLLLEEVKKLRQEISNLKKGGF